MANMKDFLTMYYNRLIFREMSYEQFLQFCGYIKDKKATDNQKIWAEELLVKDPATGEFVPDPSLTTVFKRKDLPDPADPTEGLSDDEWLKLFLAFQRAFQSMDSAKKDFQYNDKAKKFFEEYFGTNPTTGLQNLFQHIKIKPTVESRIYKAPTPPSPATVPGTLYAFLENYRHILKSRFSGGYYSITTDDFSYDDLLKGLKEGKYNNKTSFREKLEAVAGYIEGYKSDLVTAGIPASDIPNLSDYQDWYDDNNVHPFRLDQFKHEYTVLLNKLRNESKIREVFENHDKGKISGPLNKALKSQSYDDPNSDDYVQPKREDELTLTEQVGKWWSDTYSDCFEKYTKLEPDRKFFSTEAKIICKHLQKGLKKTDGLDGVLGKIGDVKKKLTAARELKSKKHLDWFEKTLNALKNDPKLDKVWAGALKNGTHMKALVKEIIIRAVKEGKKDEAKTAMELISVLHYDYTTSKIMETLGKENLTVFSDKGLSWNKNEGMKLVTAALDKGIKAAFMTLGYGVTIVGNAYKLSNSKIKKYSGKNKNFKNEHDRYLQDQATKKTSLENLLTAERAQETTTQTRVSSIQGTRTYDVAKADLEAERDTLRSGADAEQNNLQTLKEDFIKIIYDGAAGTYRVTDPEVGLISTFLNQLDADGAGTGSVTVPTLPTTPTITIPAGTPGLTPGTYDLGFLMNQILLQKDAVNAAITDRNNKQAELDDLVNGTELLAQLRDQITRHADEVANWDNNHMDEIEELALYWNRLETGRNTKMGPMYNWFRFLSKKKAQKNFDGRVAGIISAYNQNHSIAA
ncbi:MAG: hypothetical protein IJ517_01575 [Alphaproteobacteria bacterium]|nr:hypothetical protein [Alphaproteobacteria bacterium]